MCHGLKRYHLSVPWIYASLTAKDCRQGMPEPEESTDPLSSDMQSRDIRFLGSDRDPVSVEDTGRVL